MNMHLLHHTYITSNTNVSNSGRQNKQLESTSQKALIAQWIAQCHGLDQYCVYFHHCVFPPCPTQRHILTINNSPRCWGLLSQEQSSLQVWSHKSNWDGKYLPMCKGDWRRFLMDVDVGKGFQSGKIIVLIAYCLKVVSYLQYELRNVTANIDLIIVKNQHVQHQHHHQQHEHQHQHHQQHQQDQKTKVLPVANNTTEVRHEYLAKFDWDYFSLFPLLAAAAQFSAHDAAIDNKRKTTENLRSESVSEYP